MICKYLSSQFLFKAPDAEDFSAINDALTDDSSSSSDDDSDEKKSSKDSTAEAKTDIKKEPSPPAAAETPKTEISEYFNSCQNVTLLDLTRD